MEIFASYFIIISFSHLLITLSSHLLCLYSHATEIKIYITEALIFYYGEFFMYKLSSCSRQCTIVCLVCDRNSRFIHDHSPEVMEFLSVYHKQCGADVSPIRHELCSVPQPPRNQYLSSLQQGSLILCCFIFFVFMLSSLPQCFQCLI